MDEYAGGISTNYMTNGVLLNRGLGVRHPSHAVPLRPRYRKLGNGEGAGPPHHRLTAQFYA